MEAESMLERARIEFLFLRIVNGVGLRAAKEALDRAATNGNNWLHPDELVAALGAMGMDTDVGSEREWFAAFAPRGRDVVRIDDVLGKLDVPESRCTALLGLDLRTVHTEAIESEQVVLKQLGVTGDAVEPVRQLAKWFHYRSRLLHLSTSRLRDQIAAHSSAGDGTLTKRDFTRAWTALASGLSTGDLHRAFAALPRDRDNKIDCAALVTALRGAQPVPNPSQRVMGYAKALVEAAEGRLPVPTDEDTKAGEGSDDAVLAARALARAAREHQHQDVQELFERGLAHVVSATGDVSEDDFSTWVLGVVDVEASSIRALFRQASAGRSVADVGSLAERCAVLLSTPGQESRSTVSPAQRETTPSNTGGRDGGEGEEPARRNGASGTEPPRSPKVDFHLPRPQMLLIQQIRRAIRARRRLFNVPLTSMDALLEAVDKDNSGRLTRRQFHTVVRRLDVGLSATQADTIFDDIGAGGPGATTLAVSEFSDFVSRGVAEVQRIRAQEAREDVLRNGGRRGPEQGTDEVSSPLLEREGEHARRGGDRSSLGRPMEKRDGEVKSQPPSESEGHTPQSTPPSSPGTRKAPSLIVGQRVELNGVRGTVSFVGKTQFADGVWVGIALDRPVGRNDGSVDGVSYFSCQPRCGVFVRRDALRAGRATPTPKRNSNSQRTRVPSDGSPQVSEYDAAAGVSDAERGSSAASAIEPSDLSTAGQRPISPQDHRSLRGLVPEELDEPEVSGEGDEEEATLVAAMKDEALRLRQDLSRHMDSIAVRMSSKRQELSQREAARLREENAVAVLDKSLGALHLRRATAKRGKRRLLRQAADEAAERIEGKRKESCATRIQCSFRGWQARKELKKRFDVAWATVAAKFAARIQASWRGVLARRQVRLYVASLTAGEAAGQLQSRDATAGDGLPESQQGRISAPALLRGDFRASITWDECIEALESEFVDAQPDVPTPDDGAHERQHGSQWLSEAVQTLRTESFTRPMYSPAVVERLLGLLAAVTSRMKWLKHHHTSSIQARDTRAPVHARPVAEGDAAFHRLQLTADDMARQLTVAVAALEERTRTIELLQSERRDMEYRLDALAARDRAMSGSLLRSTEREAALEKEAKEARARLDELDEKEEKEAEDADEGMEGDDDHALFEEMRREHESLLRRLEMTESALRKATRDADESREAAQAARQSASRLEEELGLLNGAISALRAERTHARAAGRKTALDLAKSGVLVRQLSAENKSLCAEVASLTAEIEASSHAAATAAREKEGANNALRVLDRDNTRLRERCCALAEIRDRLRKDLERATAGWRRSAAQEVLLRSAMQDKAGANSIENVVAESIAARDAARIAKAERDKAVSRMRVISRLTRMRLVGTIEALRAELSMVRESAAETSAAMGAALSNLQSPLRQVLATAAARAARERADAAHARQLLANEAAERRALEDRMWSPDGRVRVVCRIGASTRPRRASVASKSRAIVMAARSSEAEVAVVDGAGHRRSFGFDRVLGASSRDAELFVDVDVLARAAVGGLTACLVSVPAGPLDNLRASPSSSLATETGEACNAAALEALFAAARRFAGSQRSAAGYAAPQFTASYCEVQRERILDMLAPDAVSGAAPEVGVDGSGLTVVEVSGADEAALVANMGRRNRARSASPSGHRATDAHGVFTIGVTTTAPGGRVSHGSLHVIRLARVRQQRSSGQTPDEVQDMADARRMTAAIASLLRGVRDRATRAGQSSAAALSMEDVDAELVGGMMGRILRDCLHSGGKVLVTVDVTPPRSTNDGSDVGAGLQFAGRIKSATEDDVVAAARLVGGQSGGSSAAPVDYSRLSSPAPQGGGRRRSTPGGAQQHFRAGGASVMATMRGSGLRPSQ